MTIGLIPFISCSAKAVVYYAVVNCGVFKWWQQSLIIVGLYVFGIVLGILTAFVSGKLIFKGKPVPFVMELPNYRLPSAKAYFFLCGRNRKTF